MFLSRSSSVIMDSLTTENAKYVLEKLLINFKQMVNQSERSKFEEASDFFENICNYEVDDCDSLRSESFKKLIEISLAPGHYSYEEMHRIGVNNHILFACLAYAELYSFLWSPKVSLKRLFSQY